MNIDVSQLVFRYPSRDFELRLPRLRVEPGTAAAVIGPSGSGKSTLLRLIAGIQVPDAGKIQLNDTTVSALGEAARRKFRIGNIGMVFQDFQLLEYLNVEENLRLPFRIHPSLRWTSAARRRMEELVEGMGLGERRRHRPGELSQGEMQRVAIGRALMTGPRLILADEPTGNLDPATGDRVLSILFREAKRLGSTLLVVTHERKLAEEFGQVIDMANLPMEETR